MPSSESKRGPGKSLASAIRQQRVIVAVGAGGVGKTSVAAAIALVAAQLGRRTLVLTIDPAKRLAASLGLHGGLDHTERPVPSEKLNGAGVTSGRLFAMMLDQKETFDAVIRRQAPDDASLKRIMANKLYRELSTRLAGGQEYAAMEKLDEIAESQRYDLVVLDTPPTANALDFLDAPQRMVDLLDSPTVDLFLQGYERGGRFSLRMLSAGARFVFRRLTRFVGGEMLNDIAAFFADLSVLLAGFRRRAERVHKLLHRTDTAFVAVTTADRRSVDEAIKLHDQLRKGSYNIAGCVINRVRRTGTVELSKAQVVERLVRGAEMEPTAAEVLASRLLSAYGNVQSLSAADQYQIGRLIKRGGSDLDYVQIPLLPQDVYDVEGLLDICKRLRVPTAHATEAELLGLAAEGTGARPIDRDQRIRTS